MFCAKCTEPIERGLETSKLDLNGGSLRVKNEFKLRMHSNGNQGNDADENDDGIDDDVDEDEERYAAIMAAAEDTDEDDEGINNVINIVRIF